MSVTSASDVDRFPGEFEREFSKTLALLRIVRCRVRAGFPTSVEETRTLAPAMAKRFATGFPTPSVDPVISTVACFTSIAHPSPFLCDSPLSRDSLLKDPLRPLELCAPSCAEVLPTAIDEVLNHPDS